MKTIYCWTCSKHILGGDISNSAGFTYQRKKMFYCLSTKSSMNFAWKHGFYLLLPQVSEYEQKNFASKYFFLGAKMPLPMNIFNDMSS